MKRFPWLLSILLVYPDGSGLYPTIQAAITAANDGDEIHLAPGEFTGDGNRDVDVQGKAVLIRSQADAPPYAVINTSGKYSYDLHFAFAFDEGEDRNTILENISFVGGYTGHDHSDGSIRITDSSPTIRNCEFENHTGTLVLSINGSPLIEDCLFHYNYSIGTTTCLVTGGGDPQILRCRFESNYNDASVAAAFIDSGFMDECHFVDNTTDVFAGSLGVGPHAVIEDTHISGWAVYTGGAAAASGGAVFRRCSIWGQSQNGTSLYIWPWEGKCVQLIDCSVGDIDAPDSEACYRKINNKPAPADEPLSLGIESWGKIKEAYR